MIPFDRVVPFIAIVCFLFERGNKMINQTEIQIQSQEANKPIDGPLFPLVLVIMNTVIFFFMLAGVFTLMLIPGAIPTPMTSSEYWANIGDCSMLSMALLIVQLLLYGAIELISRFIRVRLCVERSYDIAPISMIEQDCTYKGYHGQVLDPITMTDDDTAEYEYRHGQVLKF